MTTIELFWFLLKNLILHPKRATKIISKVDGAEFGSTLYDIDSAIRVKDANHAQESDRSAGSIELQTDRIVSRRKQTC